MRTKACIVRRGDKWAVKQPLPDGRYRWRTVGRRKRDAEIVRDEINRRIALGALYPSEPQTFAEFVDGWLERYAQRLRPATLASCRDSLRRLAVFDGWQLETIRAGDVEDHVFAVAQRAPRAAELMLDTLKMILRSAKGRGQTIDEGVLRVRPPRRERAEMRFLDWREVEQLASETVEPYGNLIRFACLTGMRQGELFALRDRALDLRRSTVTVEGGAREGKLVPTKTVAGRRQVRLSGEALRVLREQLHAREPNELGLVFPTPNGSVWRKDNFMARVFRPAVRRAELAPLRFHDLRHTYAALMIAAGAHPKLLQAQLGHTSINVTLNTYGHLFPDAFADVGDALDRIVRCAEARAS
ncbi:MAG TPA: site-specific integrase [Gaiellaceae bacterium]|nr:site-specific integrase [Gaiellaceae bacterium]